jgi:hypothetical protein
LPPMANLQDSAVAVFPDCGDMGQSEACLYLMTKSSVPPDYPSREESTRLDIGNHTFWVTMARSWCCK